MTDRATAETEALRRALNALERMQARLAAVQQAAREPIAVIGLGCRFPGAEGPEAFTDFLETGGDAVGDVPAERSVPFSAVGLDGVRRGGFFADVSCFDAGRFGLSDAEALAMDPHQRLLLELAWEALADAGLTDGALAGTRTGVYLALGAQNNDYAGWLLNDPQRLNGHVISGNFHSLMPGRLSYLLDLRGPSLVVDAACASALTAVHLASQALRRRECDTALVAAVNLVLSPLVSLAVQQNGLLSLSGRCHSFDAGADGFVRGEGGGVLVLKRLSDATAAGDESWAVILGSAIGQDGHGNGLSAPHGPAQEAILRQALADAGVEPAAVGYVEAHATGTRLGDAIEAQALGAVYGVNRSYPLRVGAVKPNLGHLEAASGMAGLVKVILAMQRRLIPPTLHLGKLNPDIDLDELRLELVTTPIPWPEDAALAGVSAFGMSGAGAHVIVGPSSNERRSRPLSPPFQRRRFWLDNDKTPSPLAGEGWGGERVPATPNDLLYQLDWRPAPLAAPENRLSLTLCSNGGEGTNFLRRLILLGDQTLARRLMPSLTQAGFTATISPVERLPDDPEAMLLYLVGGGLEPDLVTLRQQETKVLGGLLRLVQSVAEQKIERLRIVTAGGWDHSLTAAMALALGRTIALEHPELGCRRIDLDPQLADPAAVLAEELMSTDDEEWVRHTLAGRLIPRLTPLTVQFRPFTARSDAAYLITGGMGGIGRAVAGWLIARGARHLLLLGRTIRECPERAVWEAQGAQIRTVAADVADPNALAEILVSLDAEKLLLAGVFHVAGVTADQLLFRQDWPGFANALRAKGEGALALHHATLGRPLDVFVLFSSITALCGLAGTGAYAAANAALGALARWRRGQGLPALSIQWGTWAGSGMAEAAGAELAAQWQAHGLLPFPLTTGLAALEALLATPEVSEAVAARADWPRLARWAREEGSGAELYAELAPVTGATRHSPLATRHSLETLVRESVAEVLGLAVTDPALDRPFGELGLNSLAAITLRNRLSRRLGVPVPATLAFNHPSIAAIVRFLASRSIATPPAPSTNRSRVERMTEVEAEHHLAALLADLESKPR